MNPNRCAACNEEIREGQVLCFTCQSLDDQRPNAEKTIKIVPWIGVDLDGTLAEYDHWQGPEHIGKPIDRMWERVRRWLDQGWTVKIFTARACRPEHVKFIENWLVGNDLPELEVTCTKDYGMVWLWDDRAVQVIKNSGETALDMAILDQTDENLHLLNDLAMSYEHPTPSTN